MAEPDPGDLLARAGRWAAALAARDLAPPPALAALDERLAESHGERLDLADDPLLVAMLCGPTAVGKSSLINALAGAAIARPGLGAATAGALLYIHEDDDPARLYEYSRALGGLAGEPAAVVRHRRDALRHKVLIDTPDIDSAVLHHRALTGALVHAADLVLFVTSPEKYKVMQAAQWLAGQRPQRAIAFVLNKWDRDALGLDYAQRALLERDFRAVLGAEGFADPLVFRVSALAAAEDGDNQLAALRGWLEAGLDHSAAAAIQERRRRAGWGRLAAAIAAALPAIEAADAFGSRAAARLTTAQAEMRRSAEVAALTLPAAALDAAAWPATPGLLGAWHRAARRVGGAAAGLRDAVSGRRSAAAAQAGEGTAVAPLAVSVQVLVDDAATARLRLGPALAAWHDGVAALDRRLAAVPAEAAAALAAATLKLSPRRVLGVAVLYGFEAVLVAILVLAGWRLGAGFVSADYAAPGLLFDTAALLVIVVLLGQIAGNLFFPPPQARWRRLVVRLALRAVDAQAAAARAALDEQLAGLAQAAQEGAALLTAIDRAVNAAAPALAAPNPAVDRLFGAAPVQSKPHQPVLD